MINQSTGISHAMSPCSPIAPVVIVTKRGGNWWAAAYHALTFTGIGAICALTMMFFKPDLADQLKALSPFSSDVLAADLAEVEVAGLMDTAVEQTPANAATGNTPFARQATAPKMMSLLAPAAAHNAATSAEQQSVTRWLSKRYRVAGDATNVLVSAAYSTAREIQLDPLLILAVMAIESRFNPFAESPVGAQGLMQVMSRVHRDKFEDLGGVKAALNPIANIRVGSQILKEYVKRGGSVEAGLKLYVGAGNFDTDFGYGAKVLAEYRRLQDVALGKKVSVYATNVRAVPKPAAPLAPAKTDTMIEADATPPAAAKVPA